MDYLNYYFLKNSYLYFETPDTLLETKIKRSNKRFSINHFLSYDYPINYQHNSRGFRDTEWPNDLSNVIWCVGDSFTKGLGAPIEHTWPSILQNKSNKRCLNISINGASNQLLKNMCLQILKDHKPSTLVVMWSFFHRRHKDPWELIYLDNSSEEEDRSVFLDCYNEVNDYCNDCNIINLIVPDQPHDLNNLFQTNIIDRARDCLHFDYKTAEIYVDHILSKLT